MSFISAAAAKNRVQNYFGGKFDAFDTVGSGMKASSAMQVADTKNEAMRDYFQTMGETNLKGIKKVGGAQIAASNNALMGDIFSTVGQVAQGVGSFAAAGGFGGGGSGIGKEATLNSTPKTIENAYGSSVSYYDPAIYSGVGDF